MLLAYTIDDGSTTCTTATTSAAVQARPVILVADDSPTGTFGPTQFIGTSDTGFNMNQGGLPLPLDSMMYVADEPVEPCDYPHRIKRLKLCPVRTRPLSEPMALCYWQRGPP